eukprot:tig00021012_g16993.t1
MTAPPGRPADALTSAALTLAGEPMGIGYEADRLMGTDRHVFSVLGPNTGHHYGDIVLVLSEDVMYHPDFNVTPMAGTSYKSGRVVPRRPWAFPDRQMQEPEFQDQRVEAFHRSKLHPAFPGWHETAAREVTAWVRAKTGKEKPTLEDVLAYWEGVDSHFVFECHLPRLVPLSYVEKIIMPKDIFEGMREEDRALLHAVFPRLEQACAFIRLNVLVLTAPVGAEPDPDVPKSLPHPSRCPPRKEVWDRCFAVERSRAKALASSPAGRGLGTPFATLLYPPLGFADTPVGRRRGFALSLARDKGTETPLPLRPPESGELHLYFQARGRDFFVVLADHEDASNETRRVLTVSLHHAGEGTAYISDQVPTAHKFVNQSCRWLAMCKDFDAGLDLEDYTHYALHYSYPRGTLTVEHWGPSAVYNRRVLSADATGGGAAAAPRLAHVSVSSWGKPAAFRGIRILPHPLPAIPTPVLEYSPAPAPAPAPAPTPAPAAASRSPTGPRPAHYSASTPPSSSSSPPAPPPARRASAGTSPRAADRDLPPCPDGFRCARFADPAHAAAASHPFPPPCADFRLCRLELSGRDPQHGETRSHLCRYGSGCREIDEPSHALRYRHVPLPPCPAGRACDRTRDWRHREVRP